MTNVMIREVISKIRPDSDVKEIELDHEIQIASWNTKYWHSISQISTLTNMNEKDTTGIKGSQSKNNCKEIIIY